MGSLLDEEHSWHIEECLNGTMFLKMSQLLLKVVYDVAPEAIVATVGMPKNTVRGNRRKAVNVWACARKSFSKWRWIKLNVESEVDGISFENLLEMYRISPKKPEGGWKCRQGRVEPLL